MQHSNPDHEHAAELLRRVLAISDDDLPSHKLEGSSAGRFSSYANPLGRERVSLGYWLDLYRRVGSGEEPEAEATELLERMSVEAEADAHMRTLILEHGWSASGAAIMWANLTAVLEHLHRYGLAHATNGERFDVLSLADLITDLDPAELGRVTRAAARTLAATVGEVHRDRATLATAAVADLAALVVDDDATFLELRELGRELLEGEDDDELFQRIGANLRRAREGAV